MSYEVEFASTLFRVEGKGGWTFAPVPEELAPSVSGPWGRTSVIATVDGQIVDQLPERIRKRQYFGRIGRRCEPLRRNRELPDEAR